MSVYIKGFPLPNNCGACPLRLAWCRERIYMVTRPERCPLVPVPPHGRLADLGKIENEIAQLSPEGYTTGGIRLILDHAPTIIQADGNLQNNSGNANNSEVIANIPAEEGER